MQPSWISTRAGLALAAALFALVYALQVLGGAEHDIFATLYAIPVVVLALVLGRRGGLAGAVLSMVLIASRLALQEVPNPDLRFGVRSLMLVVVGWSVGALVDRLRRSHALLNSVVASARDGIFVKDGQGRYVVMNAAAAQLVGRRPEDVLGRTDHDLFARETADLLAAGDAATIRTGDTFSADETFTVDGEERVTGTSKSPLHDPDGRVMGVVGFARDVTERNWRDRELVAAHERFRRALQESPIGVGVTDLKGCFTEVNVAFAQLLGRDESDVIGTTDLALTHPQDLPMCERAFARLTEGDTESLHVEKRFLHADGHPVWVHQSLALIRDEKGRPSQVLVQVLDVTERQRTEEFLAHQALHDALTGLPNRQLLLERTHHALKRHQRDQRDQRPLLGVIFIDLDRFKPINDTLGHSAGDSVLIEVARRLQSLVRTGDTVARLGGDEFTVLAEDLETDSDAHHIAERILDAIARPFLVAGREVFIGASIGIAYSRDPTTVSAETLLRDADTAMYEAKRTGQRVVDHTEALRAVGQHRLDVEAGLREALLHNAFLLEWQLQVQLDTGRAVGIEALVRWRRPDGEIAAPATFVPLAEETGLIVPIGDVVLNQACATAATWRHVADVAGIRVAVNLSARQFADASLVDRVRRALGDHRIDPGRLELEITESVLMRDAELTLSTLHALKDLGVHIAVDDFGTGYSSLAYLHRFPVDRVKIDRSFISTLDSPGSPSTRLVEAIVSMAHALRMDVVAEGVEGSGQLETLRSIGVDVVQGYLVGKPQSADDAWNRIAESLDSPHGGWSAWSAAP